MTRYLVFVLVAAVQCIFVFSVATYLSGMDEIAYTNSLLIEANRNAKYTFESRSMIPNEKDFIASIPSTVKRALENGEEFRELRFHFYLSYGCLFVSMVCMLCTMFVSLINWIIVMIMASPIAIIASFEYLSAGSASMPVYVGVLIGLLSLPIRALRRKLNSSSQSS